MKFKRFQPYKNIALILLVSVFLVSCASQPPANAYDPPGFFMGVLHGFCILFSLIASVFTDIRIYSFPNTGGWYDFGYFIAASIFLGGSGASSN